MTTTHFKSARLNVLSLRMPKRQSDLRQLEHEISQKSGFFLGGAAVLDVEGGSDLEQVSFPDVFRLLENAGVSLLGAVCADDDVARRFAEAGLPVINTTAIVSERSSPWFKRKNEAEKARPSAGHSESQEGDTKAVTVIRQIRSGERVEAPGRDLVVVGSVSPGAEIVAGGSIHVFGALRGRALAGTDGGSDAIIVCQRLEAELVSINGIYLENDRLPADVRGRQVYLTCDGKGLFIHPF